MSWKCLFGHDWVYSGHENANFGKYEHTIHKYRICKNCKRIEKSFNRSLQYDKGLDGKPTDLNLICDWVQIDEKEYVAEKI